MLAFKSSPLPRKDPLRVGIPLSLVLHAILLAVILSSNAPHPPEVGIINVSLEMPKSLRNQPKEIVSPPLQKSLTPPENTNKLSDSDSVAVKEQVRRGTEGGAAGAPSTQPQQPAKRSDPQQPSQPQQPPPPPQPKEQQPPPQPNKERSSSKGEHHLKSLKLDDATLAMKFGNPSAQRSSQSKPSSRASSLSEYQAFSRPPGSGAAFLGNGGTNDHLPNLPDGDITMLNAKANTYASFVRRVAVQVFTQLRSQGWERLSRQQIQQLGDFTTVEAVLSRQGTLMGVRIHGTSGSSSFDSVVQQSVKAGAQDPNPPPGAEAQDGNIHFIFKARSWSQMGVNPRSGIPSEHRWLLLATGLE
jgi:TonB family protein